MSRAHEFLLAASVMAAPEYLEAVAAPLEDFRESASKAVIEVLRKDGVKFAAIGAMEAAIQDLPYTVDPQDLLDLFSMIPDDSVTVSSIVSLSQLVRKAAAGRRLTAQYLRIAKSLESGTLQAEDLVGETSDMVSKYKLSKQSKDRTARGGLKELREGTPQVRWKSCIDDFNLGFFGLDKDQKPTQAIYASREVTIVAALYKVGKTRKLLNEAVSFLDQGASVALVMLEDDAKKINCKLIATKMNIEPWKVQYHALGKLSVLKTKTYEQDVETIEEGLKWFEELGDRWRVIDGTDDDYNIYNWNDTKDFIVADKFLYNTDIVLIDYLQQFNAEEVSELNVIAKEIRAMAMRQDIHIYALSQVSNASGENGIRSGMLAAKGTNAWGATVHNGINMYREEGVGNKEIVIDLGVVRDGEARKNWVQFEPTTGRIRVASAQPEFLPQPALKKGKK